MGIELHLFLGATKDSRESLLPVNSEGSGPARAKGRRLYLS
jgi:hypothetical protein